MTGNYECWHLRLLCVSKDLSIAWIRFSDPPSVSMPSYSADDLLMRPPLLAKVQSLVNELQALRERESVTRYLHEIEGAV